MNNYSQKLIFIALLLSLLFISVSLSQIDPTFSDLDYVGAGNEKQFLDIYIPDGLTEPAPILMWIHGGAWRSGAKGGAYRRCDSLYLNGYIIADINYRLTDESIFPTQIHDCKAAIRFLKANADEYMIDTCRFAIAGSSAGGHLACFLGATNDVDSLEDLALGNGHVSSRVHAVCDFYGATDFLRMNDHVPMTPPDSCMSYLDHETETSPESIFLGCHIIHCPDRVRDANPITYLDSSDPPFIIFHGSYDCTVPAFQSIILDSALSELGIEHELYIIPHAGHGSMPEFQWEMQKHRMRSFLDRIFSTAATTENHDTGDIEAIRIHPNPFNSSLGIFANKSGTLRIYDLMGELVFSSTNRNRLFYNWQPEKACPSGFYFIVFENENKTVQEKVQYIK